MATSQNGRSKKYKNTSGLGVQISLGFSFSLPQLWILYRQLYSFF
jgi:hypothetical protein